MSSDVTGLGPATAVEAGATRVVRYCGSPETVAELYPQLLTERRFEEWATLFAEGALMVRVEAGVPTSIQSVAAALPEQIEYGAENERFVETWTDVSILTKGNLSIVTAFYTLEVDHETRQGLDVLTLAADEKGWQIVSLVYEQYDLTTT